MTGVSLVTWMAVRAAEPSRTRRDTRRELAAEFLRGRGVEIGALHLPMALPEGWTVRYIDRMTSPSCASTTRSSRVRPRRRLMSCMMVSVCPQSSRSRPTSSSPIISSEHCGDPIRTIETHLGKLRPRGVLFYVVPDKRYTFDFRRPRRPLSRVVAADEDGGQASRRVIRSGGGWQIPRPVRRALDRRQASALPSWRRRATRSILSVGRQRCREWSRADGTGRGRSVSMRSGVRAWRP